MHNIFEIDKFHEENILRSKNPETFNKSLTEKDILLTFTTEKRSKALRIDPNYVGFYATRAGILPSYLLSNASWVNFESWKNKHDFYGHNYFITW